MTYGRVSERSAVDWLLAIGIVGVVMLIGYAGLQSMNKTRIPAIAEQQDQAPPTGLPPGTYYFEIPANEPVRVEKPAVAGVVSIYECFVNGQKILSDRDCGPDAVQRDVDTRGLNTYEAGPIPYVDMRRYGAPPREYLNEPPQYSGLAGDPKVWKQERCNQIEEQIDRLNARMRIGYTSQQGEYLRARWYKAKNAYSEARCGKPD